MWISKHPLNNSLAVFIHGIWGSRWTTWKSYVDFFQRLPTDKPFLRNYDVYLFNYETNPIKQPPLRPEIVRKLRRFLEVQNEKYDTIILICHSQGGVLGKLYILEELIEGRGEEMKIDMIVTLNTPNRGADWRNPGILLSLLLSTTLNTFWGLRRLYWLRQLADLAPYSANIRFLRSNWGEPYISPVVNELATAQRRYIRSVAISGLRDSFVSKYSAEGYSADEKNGLYVGHSVDSEQVADEIGHYLSSHESPAALLRQLKAIDDEPHQRKKHRENCEREAALLIEESPQFMFPEGYVSRRATCFADDFYTAFKRRPLRKLAPLEAFKSYVKRVLED